MSVHRVPLPSPLPLGLRAPVQGRADAVPPAQMTAVRMLADGVIAPHAFLHGLTGRGSASGLMADAGGADQGALYQALSRYTGIGIADFGQTAPDLRLIDRLGALTCLRLGVLPWQVAGGITVIAAPTPEIFAKHRAALTETFGPVALALAAPRQIEAALLTARGPALARASERTVPLEESCRMWTPATSARLTLLCLGVATLAALWPELVLGLLLGWAVLTLAVTMALKLAALWLALRPARADGPAPIIARLPTVSVIVALYREADIAARLVRRLGKLDYPRHLLDIVLAVEAEDHLTRAALDAAELPPWMRIVVAPEGRVKTKPRALNFALGLCRGSIVGVYDAEDAPDPDQINRVVERFHRRGPQVACVQGMLDFYNPHTNWLSRCFTIEYASWFRVILPGLERLGFPIPLGGTTLFFRRDVLEKLGGWDAWNVTEDADLGVRLARHGYRTEILDTTTYEEANCRALPWVKQRSRWNKGYMMTYITHMRRPAHLWRELGWWQFVGFQVLFLGSISQVLLVPLMWSLWIMSLGLWHPLQADIPPTMLMAMTALFVACEVLGIVIGVVGLRRSGHRLSPLWVPTLHVYHPLAALSSFKALWEMMHRPFYWDKTSHGHFDQ